MFTLRVINVNVYLIFIVLYMVCYTIVQLVFS